MRVRLSALPPFSLQPDPSLSPISSRAVFGEASSLNADLSLWDVSSVIHMRDSASLRPASHWLAECICLRSHPLSRAVFWGASSFNSDLSSWDVSSVTSMIESASLHQVSLPYDLPS